MAHTSKNYMTDGGNKTVIGGTLEVLEGATVTGLTETAAAASASALGGVKAAEAGAGDTVECKINNSTKKLYVPAYPGAATTEAAGLVKQAANVPEVDGALTADDFNALLDALITAGIMAAPAAGQEG
jgi:hypothetical protein